MLKSCLLLDKKFSTKSIINIPGVHISNPPKKKGEEKEEPKKDNNNSNNQIIMQKKPQLA